MKKSMVCVLCVRCLLMFIIKRMSSIAAPVVPMNDASRNPTARIKVFIFGVASISPSIAMPPVTTNSEQSRIMNGK